MCHGTAELKDDGRHDSFRPSRVSIGVLLLLAWLTGFSSVTQAQAISRTQTLRDRHDALAGQLRSNQFQRPLHLESTQTEDALRGDVYARIRHPFAAVSAGLQGATHWCDILMLHLNVKHCRASGPPAARAVTLTVGRKRDSPFSESHTIQLDYQLVTSAADYLSVQLGADTGPLSTRDYHIAVEAIPLDAQQSFLHMSYSYNYGITARLAMQSYLATLGRNKVGFSIVGKQPDGTPEYVGGVRGVIERNTMRYYLAIDAYLNSLSAPPSKRAEQRLREWYAGTEHYRRQLHEMGREEYLNMKRAQLRQLQSGSAHQPVE